MHFILHEVEVDAEETRCVSGAGPDDGSADRGPLSSPPGNPMVAGFTTVVS